MDTLDIADDIRIPMSEIRMTAMRAQGSGGQNVNKVSTAIHLKFDSQNCAALPPRVKSKLLEMSDHRVTDDGTIIIKSQAFRSQDRNRLAALSRLSELLRRASRTRKRRIPTRPSKQAKQKRLDNKDRRGKIKKSRRNVFDES